MTTSLAAEATLTAQAPRIARLQAELTQAYSATSPEELHRWMVESAALLPKVAGRRVIGVVALAKGLSMGIYAQAKDALAATARGNFLQHAQQGATAAAPAVSATSKDAMQFAESRPFSIVDASRHQRAA